MNNDNHQPQIFEHEQFGQIRVVVIDGMPWFVAADVCRVLDIDNVSQAVDRLDDDEKAKIPENGVTTDPHFNIGSTGTPFLHEINVVNEPGLYRLVFTSRKPEAEAFKHWVYHEVLPSIRQTGSYSENELAMRYVKLLEHCLNLKMEYDKLHARCCKIVRQLEAMETNSPNAQQYNANRWERQFEAAETNSPNPQQDDANRWERLILLKDMILTTDDPDAREEFVNILVLAINEAERWRHNALCNTTTNEVS